jgi:FdhD protein
MVIKAVQMGIPILASRSGFTAWGVDLARQVGLTLIGRARGKRFVVLSGEDRVEYDADNNNSEDESDQFNRKGAAE